MAKPKFPMKTGIVRRPGYMYIVGDGAVLEISLGEKQPPKKVATISLKRDEGFMYWVDLDGNVDRRPISETSAGAATMPPVRRHAPRTPKPTKESKYRASEGLTVLQAFEVLEKLMGKQPRSRAKAGPRKKAKRRKE